MYVCVLQLRAFFAPAGAVPLSNSHAYVDVHVDVHVGTQASHVDV